MSSQTDQVTGSRRNKKLDLYLKIPVLRIANGPKKSFKVILIRTQQHTPMCCFVITRSIFSPLLA